MLTLVAVLLLVVLLVVGGFFLFNFETPKKRTTTVPGLDSSHPEHGNASEIASAGGFHRFLTTLHKRFGGIASFWVGKQLVVSIASEKLFKEHRNVFDRPVELYLLFEPLFTIHSLTYANKSTGKMRRKLYDPCFVHSSLPQYFAIIQQVADEEREKLLTSKGDHIALEELTFDSAIKCNLRGLFGAFYDDDNEVVQFRRAYFYCFDEMESTLETGIPLEGSARFEDFAKYRADMFNQMSKALAHRKALPSESKTGDRLFVDVLLDSDLSEEVILADAITFMVASIHTTALLCVWCLYYLATHQDIQEKVYQEIQTVLGEDNVTPSNVADLVYMKQVLDETLRCSVLAPYAARVQHVDSELGGHKIPANTPVMQALGVSFQDPDEWENPTRFDPERFSEENKKNRSTLAFQPFGFSGKRHCPGDRLAYVEATIFMVTQLRAMVFNMVEGQVVIPKHGLVTKPTDEIWVTVTPRK